MSGQRENRVALSETPDGETSPESNQANVVANTKEGGEIQSEVEELTESCADTITCLLRISFSIRRATASDRYVKAAAARENAFIDRPDILHVGQKFPKLRNTWLQDRFGRAITRRRQFLRYCRMHQDKIAQETVSRTPEAMAPLEAPRKTEANQTPVTAQNELSGNRDLRVPSVLPSTKATTLNIPNAGPLPVLQPDDSGSSTVATTFLGAERASTIGLPRVPDEAGKGNEFECPFCCKVQVFRSRRMVLNSWR